MAVAILFAFVCSIVTVSGFTESQRQDASNAVNFADVMDVSDFSVYYDLETNQTIKNMLPRPWYRPGWSLRLPFTAGPCTCEGLQCSCCTGLRLPVVNFDRKTCAVLTYEPIESMIELEVKMNENRIFRNSFSARNPPPFCVPVIVPYLPPGLLDMCIRLFDISVVDRKLHVCMDMDTRVDKAPVLVLHFDCMDMGTGGVGLSKPSNNTNILPDTGSVSSTTAEPTQADSDIYDTVTENSPQTTSPPFQNAIKYI